MTDFVVTSDLQLARSGMLVNVRSINARQNYGSMSDGYETHIQEKKSFLNGLDSGNNHGLKKNGRVYGIYDLFVHSSRWVKSGY